MLCPRQSSARGRGTVLTSVGTPASPFRLVILAIAAIAAIGGLLSLGIWQLQRLAWKESLIERVEQRVHAEPVAAPGPDRWAMVDADSSEYLHVRVVGRFLHDRETLVQAVTVRGGGFWVLTPLELEDGFTVLINRGFVSAKYRDPAARVAGQVDDIVTITGLLRITETGRGFLRENEPEAERWYSRDVTAIAAARGLQNVAPYFIDADKGDSTVPGSPEGGLTVLTFRNTHLQYALTWFALALMAIGGALLVFRHEWRLRKGRTA